MKRPPIRTRIAKTSAASKKFRALRKNLPVKMKKVNYSPRGKM